MRIICISDTHSYISHHSIPNGDVIVCSGDFTRNGSDGDIMSFATWFSNLPHKYKIVIAGNHDISFEKKPQHAQNLLNKASNSSILYLQDTEIVIDGIKFYGSPWQPEFFNWAFNLPRNKGLLANKWAQIPIDTDILITHGPIFGILDKCNNGQYVGCEELRHEVLNRVKPLAHIFGHIHESYGHIEFNNIHFINASICTLNYMPTNAPFIIDVLNKKINNVFYL